MPLCSFGTVALLVGLIARCGPSLPGDEATLADACRYLWSQQAADGGWHSATHGLLRGGQAWTPFILHTLIEAPSEICPPPPNGVERARAFLRQHINEEGVLGLADPDVLEYPNYATAYALRVMAQAGTPGDSSLVRAMTGYLIDQQFAEHRDMTPDDPAYGSWGFGEQRLPPGQAGHVDLSHTRRVVQALRITGHVDTATYRRAQVFLARAQKFRPDSTYFDGGFYASPVVFGVNKSDLVASNDEPSVFASYATATADGLLALLAAGLDLDDPAVLAAAQWLRTHPSWAYPEGIPANQPVPWRRVLFYYHLAVRAEAYAALDEPGAWGDSLHAVLAGRQQPDGSFANPEGAPNKEDDPLLATALVVRALSSYGGERVGE